MTCLLLGTVLVVLQLSHVGGVAGLLSAWSRAVVRRGAVWANTLISQVSGSLCLTDRGPTHRLIVRIIVANRGRLQITDSLLQRKRIVTLLGHVASEARHIDGVLRASASITRYVGFRVPHGNSRVGPWLSAHTSLHLHVQVRRRSRVEHCNSSLFSRLRAFFVASRNSTDTRVLRCGPHTQRMTA